MNKNFQTTMFTAEIAENYKVRKHGYASTVREKLVQRGASALRDAELLQILVDSGDDIDVPSVARNVGVIIRKVGVDNVTFEDIMSIDGVCEVTASLFFAAFEFWRRKLTASDKPVIDSPDAAASQFDDIKNANKEHVAMITLDGARRPINKHLISVGTLTSSLVHPREIFQPAIEDRAASIIIAHNHPSGVLTISEQDRDVTKRIQDAGELMGIPLDDHLIVAKSGYVSVPA